MFRRLLDRLVWDKIYPPVDAAVPNAGGRFSYTSTNDGPVTYEVAADGTVSIVRDNGPFGAGR